MAKNAVQCVTLAEYRLEVLRVPQSEIAHAARCKQAWISQCEGGHLPRPWKRENLVHAYKLTDEQFCALVNGSKAAREMRKTMAETYPLFASALSDHRGTVTPIYATNPSAPHGLPVQTKQA